MEWVCGKSQSTVAFDSWLIDETGLTTYDFEAMRLSDEECAKELTVHLQQYQQRTGLCGIDTACVD